MNLNDDLLKNNLKLYVRELQNINNRETSSTLQQNMITDIQLYSRNMLNDNVRNTHAGLHGILMSFLFSEDPTENRIGFVISRGSSSNPSLTLSTARLLQDANVQMFALGTRKYMHLHEQSFFKCLNFFPFSLLLFEIFLVYHLLVYDRICRACPMVQV